MSIVDTIVVLFISISSILLSAVFIIKNPHRSINRIAAIISLSVATWIATAFLSDLPQFHTQALFLNRFLLVAVASVVTSMFFFAYHFPVSSKLNPLVRSGIIAFSLILSIVTVTTPLTIKTINFESWGTNPQYGWFFNIFTIYLTLLLLASTAKFIQNYKRARGLSKLQMKYLFFGIFVFMLINLFVHVVLSYLIGSVEYYKIGNYSAIFFVLFLAIAIIKHRLMDIRLIIARTVAYTILIITFTLMYIGLITNLEKFLLPTHTYPNQLGIPALVTIILLFCFQPIHHLINKITSSIFYQDSYDTHTFINFISEQIRNNVRLTLLINPIIDAITQTLHIEGAQCIVASHNNIISKYSLKPLIADPSPSTLHNLNSMTTGGVIIFDELEESSFKDFLRQYCIGALMPLKTSVASHGFILLGEKQSGQAYTAQDIEVLNILTNQISVAIQNALSYEEINQFNQILQQKIDQATQDLKNANKSLKHLDKLKDEFVFIATHELKNPVTAMRGYLSLLQEGVFGEIPESMQEPINQLQASNQQLVELVNDLLQVARSEAKTLTIHTEPVNLCPLIDVVKDTLKPLSDQKYLTVIHHCVHPTPQVLADPQRVKEIINNLLSNAIKYSNTGTITISHQVKTDRLITHVADQGIGISAADQKKLFTRFFRVEEEATQGIPGTGLGLFIVKQLLEKMGGNIWVSSEKGVGSTFSFSLPIA